LKYIEKPFRQRGAVTRKKVFIFSVLGLLFFPCLGLMGQQKTFKKISEVFTKSTRKKFVQSWVINILKRESTILANEVIIRHNICNSKLQTSNCDV
jgi:hypothetical protein